MLWQWLHHLLLEEKQVLLEAKNLNIRKNKIAEILSTYTHDVFNNTTLQ